MYCLNGGECCYLIDEDMVSCNCTKLYGGKRRDKYMWWNWVAMWEKKDEKIFDLKSDEAKRC